MKKHHTIHVRITRIFAVLLSLFVLAGAVPVTAMAANAKYKLTKQNVQMYDSSEVYTGKALEPSVSVYGMYYGMLLEKNVDYTVTYKNNKQIGNASVTVKGTGNCKGTVKLSFKILPPATNFRFAEAKTNEITLNWKPLEKIASGYLLTYGKAGQSKKKQTSVTIKNPAASSYRITGLKADTAYEFSLQTYKDVNGTKFVSEETIQYLETESKETEDALPAPMYDSWNVQKEADVFIDSDVDLNTILNPADYGLSHYEWVNGEGPYYNLYDNTAYMDSIGTFVAYLVSEEDAFVGRVLLHVQRKDISKAVISGLSDVSYDGFWHTPEPTVTLNGEPLSSWDYTCLYEDNQDAGTATVYIQGSGDYKGIAVAHFKINPIKAHLKLKNKKRNVIISPYRKSGQAFWLGAYAEEGVKVKTSLQSVSPAKGKKFISVSSAGKLSVTKKAKAGTYTVKVLVKSDASKNYKKTEKTLTCKVTVKKRGKASYPSFAKVGITGIDAATEKRANKVLDDMVADLYDAGIDFFHLSALKKAKYVAHYIDMRYPYKSAYVNGKLVASRLGTSLSLVLSRNFGDCWGFSDTKRCLLRKVGIKKTWCSIAGNLDVGNTNHMRCIVQIGKKYYELNEIHEANLLHWCDNIGNYDWYFYNISKARAMFLIGKGKYKKGIEMER